MELLLDYSCFEPCLIGLDKNKKENTYSYAEVAILFDGDKLVLASGRSEWKRKDGLIRTRMMRT